LSRTLGIRGFRTSMLFAPDTNLKIGTYYLKALSDQLEGKWEAALASYNAGKSRVVAWLAASNFSEPAEFVESIPFNETRGYVESVLRNAEVYRRLYGPKTVAEKAP
jgi:soluble lytic murein transglycosylase